MGPLALPTPYIQWQQKTAFRRFFAYSSTYPQPYYYYI